MDYTDRRVDLIVPAARRGRAWLSRGLIDFIPARLRSAAPALV
jgi:hypothetical protein